MGTLRFEFINDKETRVISTWDDYEKRHVQIAIVRLSIRDTQRKIMDYLNAHPEERRP